MPRVHRGLIDGFMYHVINRGNGKQKVFHKSSDYQAFIDLIGDARLRYPVKIIAYCLMPNHFHFLLMPERGEDLSKFMQWLMTSHVRRYHRHYGTSGHVWQGRFKSFIIRKDEHLLSVLRYIEGNPVRAGLARLAIDWNWSSHAERLGQQNRDLIYHTNIEMPADWEAFVNTSLPDKELEGIRNSVNRQAPYGKIEWKMRICKELGLESTMRPRGRQSNVS